MAAGTCVSAATLGTGELCNMHRKTTLRVILSAIILSFLLATLVNFTVLAELTSTNKNFEWTQNLRRWLDLAYSESDNFAGFGDLGSDQITAPNLYITRGAAQILRYLGVKVEDPQPIGAWINSLANDQGAYDDPLNHAPLMLETYWAVTTLQTLGIPPCEPTKTMSFVLGLQGDDGLFHYDQFIDNTLWNNISCTDVALTILDCLGTEDLPQVKSALNRAADRVVEAVNNLLSSVNGDWHKFDEKETENFESGLHLLSRLAPEKFPKEGKEALVYYISEIPSMPGDFLTPKVIDMLLLDTAEAVGLIKSDEIPTLPGLKEYLLKRVVPEISTLGGYGWRNRWAERLDPMMTWPTVKLFARAGIPYPQREVLLRTISKYRIKEGWISVIIPVPEVGYTCFGLGVAKYIGWKDYDPEKMSSFAYSILQNSRANIRDTYWAAKLLEELGKSKEKLVSILDPTITKLWKQGRADDVHTLAFLLAELRLPVPAWAVQPLQKEAEALVPKVSTGGPYGVCIRHIRELAFIQNLLGREWIPKSELQDKTLSLQAEAGGFKACSDAPCADLFSTYQALETLEILNALGDFDARKTISFVLSCKRNYGYSWTLAGTNPTPSPPDLYSTYVGVRVLQLLHAFLNGPR